MYAQAARIPSQFQHRGGRRIQTRAFEQGVQKCTRGCSFSNESYDCIKSLKLGDPACGTAGFLVAAADYIRKHYEDTMTQEQWDAYAGTTFTGFDTDRTMLRISAMNLMLHSITNPEINYKDSVSKQNDISSKYTICLANPPFKGTIDAESINDNLKAVTNTKKTELLFLALFIRIVIGMITYTIYAVYHQ